MFSNTFVTAIIVAAGNSARMGKGINKQMAMINDKPVLAHSIEAFNKSNNINSIVVVCRNEDKETVHMIIEQYNYAKVSAIVGGGETRQESVFNGIKTSPDATTHFAIHDGARAMIEKRLIRDVVMDAIEYKSAALGVKVKDTIKLIDAKGNIKGTVDRRSLYAIQTPQVFEKSIYLDAMRKSKFEGRVYSDDCQLIERLRIPIHITEGSYENIKITTIDDLAYAHIILGTRDEE